MFELHITDTDISSGSVPVSWCIDRETATFLKEKEIKNPLVVFIVTSQVDESEHREHRYIVPLNQLMTYIYFRFPGKNNIYAFITGKSLKDAKSMYFSKWGAHGPYAYQYTVLEPGGESYQTYFKELDVFKTHYAEPVSVDVPKDCFAKEPSAFEKEWTNWLFDFGGKPPDQCSFRKRRLLSLLQIPVLMGNLFIRLFMLLISALLMFRGFSLKYLLHPLTYDLNDSLAVWGEGSLFIRNDSSKIFVPTNCGPLDALKYAWKKCFTLLFSPLFIIFYIALYQKHALLIGVNVFTLVVMFAFIAALIIQLVVTDAFVKLFNKLFPFSEKISDSELNVLLCSPDKKPASFKNLPSSKKTIKLRILDLKSKVCRPFPG